MQCGLPEGDKCETNNDCSSFNCVNYSREYICGEPSNSGCHSACGMEGLLIVCAVGIFISIIMLCFCACCYNRYPEAFKKYIIYPIVVIVILLSFGWVFYEITIMPYSTLVKIIIIVLILIASPFVFIIIFYCLEKILGYKNNNFDN